MTKIRDVLSDDKRDWELRVAAVSRPRLLSQFEASFLSGNRLFLSSPVVPAEEGAFAAPGRRRRVRWVPAAAAAHGGGVQAVRQGPAVSGGEGGLHHSGVRREELAELLHELPHDHRTHSEGAFHMEIKLIFTFFIHKLC